MLRRCREQVVCQNKKTRLTYASRVWQGRRDSPFSDRWRGERGRTLKPFARSRATRMLSILACLELALHPAKKTTYLAISRLAGETRFAIQRSLARRARQNVQAVRPIACNAYAQHTCVSRARAQPCQNKKTTYLTISRLAGETRFEHATNGFGDHYSTVEPLP